MEIRTRLGSGGFADVFEGTYDRKQVALKKMKPTTKNPAATQEAFESELLLLSLHHPHVIKLIAVEREPEPIVILEFIPGAVDLQTRINQENSYDWRQYACQLASALSYLHRHDILHLDLKPANVLLDTGDCCKIIDFGCAQKASNARVSSLQGTLSYRAPELFRGHRPTRKADVYSLGITLWSLKNQKQPYEGQNDMGIVYQVVALQRRPGNDAEFQTLWHADPDQRPEAEQLLF